MAPDLPLPLIFTDDTDRDKFAELSSLNSWPTYPNFLLCCDHKASCPFVHILNFKNLTDAADQAEAARWMETHQQNAAVSSRNIKPSIRKIQVLCDQKPLFALRGGPYLWIATSR